MGLGLRVEREPRSLGYLIGVLVVRESNCLGFHFLGVPCFRKPPYKDPHKGNLSVE